MPTYQFDRAHIVRGETKRAGLKDESAIARQNAQLIEIEVLSASLSLSLRLRRANSSQLLAHA